MKTSVTNMRVIILLATISCLYIANAALTEKNKQEILEMHNKLRSMVANGQFNNQPSATNMKEMKWSEEAARMAQEYADQCKFEHNSKKDRLFGTYWWVGQNIAVWSDESVTSGVQMWFDEGKKYTYKTQHCNGECGHYTAMVWANTDLVGCGISDCSANHLGTKHLICNYAPGGNVKFYDVMPQPYKEGKVCSQCDAGYSCRYGLCSSMVHISPDGNLICIYL